MERLNKSYVAGTLKYMYNALGQISTDALNMLADAIEYSLIERKEWVYKNQGNEMLKYIAQEVNKEDR